MLLFIARLLKALHFQPRMALITRTLGNAATDLVHFAILFLLVLAGYGMVRSLLFGHQYEAFSTPALGMTFLFLCLMGLAPDLFWVQVTTGPPSPAECS